MTKEERDNLNRQHDAVDETIADIQRLAKRMNEAAENVLSLYREVRSA